MQIRTIEANEVCKLTGCLTALAEHHNMVSLHFGGAYPSRPYEQTLELFSAALINGQSKIAVIEEQDGIIGFCKADITAASGKIDYLIVLPEHRGKGYGTALIDWAMKVFRQRGVKKRGCHRANIGKRPNIMMHPLKMEAEPPLNPSCTPLKGFYQNYGSTV